MCFAKSPDFVNIAMILFNLSKFFLLYLLIARNYEMERFRAAYDQ